MGTRADTREALQRAALELFLANGYDATPTAAVARAAGVSEMTLFRHFASKEALLLDDPYDPQIAEAVAGRPAEERPMRAVVEGIRAAWRDVDPDDAAHLRTRLRIVAEAATLRGALERNSEATVAALTDALITRGVAASAARVAATAVIAGLSTALLDWARSDRDDLGAVLGRALDTLGGG
ncbi:TetR/AcrR family transcriptional regulator [Occultella gossypii]|uniref:TetR/AcrR family transcriptional regulator n=1 Tax=Occultella gossypii TaxID=2800820 RepID=UPI001CBA7DD3|nr:TetR/AcrR family transcriptional regulator [Occultella gossypii]